ncbi:MAG: HEAT repeat domain-containing protein [Deltaproteobacteria bacterium]
MSYDLEVLADVHGPVDLAALAAQVRSRVDQINLGARGAGLADDGTGFVIERTARGARLSAGNDRGARDEWGMELCASILAGRAGTVLDRHTGRLWTYALLDEWLRVGPLFSGRALASNHERIAHVTAPVAVDQFGARVEAMTAYCAGASASPALRGRVRDELVAYVSRAQFTWIAARAMAALGDLSALEQLTRTIPHGSEPDPFVVAAGYGAPAVELFSHALSDPDPNHRRAAARAIHHLHHPEALALIARALEDRRSTVREAVLDADFDGVMARAGAREALGPVLARLSRDPSTLVRRSVARFQK